VEEGTWWKVKVYKGSDMKATMIARLSCGQEIRETEIEVRILTKLSIIQLSIVLSYMILGMALRGAETTCGILGGIILPIKDGRLP
jgi:hypothetical protein